FIDGVIRDSKTNEVVADARVEFKDVVTGAVLASVTTDANGFFKSDSIFGKMPNDQMKVHLDVTKRGYAPTSVDADVTFGGEPVVHLNEVMNPLISEIAIGTDLGLSINPIYFDYRKWNIRPDAAAELDKIVKIMKDNPKMKIALGSHTDARGTDEENQLLSDKRAKSSVDYIVSKGLSRNRITGQGYGESQLKVSNETIQGTYLWVEQEKLHQLNRRTEFIIVK
ncbi:MAG: OmpA family protein, partial [Fluviicola sp.]|nr:OmpA family protein [Fluviicola sp.]